MKRTGGTLIDVDEVNWKITGGGRVQICAVKLKKERYITFNTEVFRLDILEFRVRPAGGRRLK